MLDEGNRKSQPLPNGTTTDSKDSRGNVQPSDKGLPSIDSNEGTTKTTPHPEGPLRDKYSEGNKQPADMEPINPTIADPSGTGAEYELVHATMDSLDKIATDRVNLLNALNRVTETLKVVQGVVKNFDFQGLKSSTESLQADALRQDEYLASWSKSSNSLAWNLGPRIIVVESSQAVIRYDISSLRQDTSEIKSMMLKIY
ncbi:hypothetical protein Tco_1555943 [Tanacetum coccineum]